MGNVKIIIADDHTLVRAGLKSLLKDISNLYGIKFTLIKTRGTLIEKIKEVIDQYKVDLVITGNKGADDYHGRRC